MLAVVALLGMRLALGDAAVLRQTPDSLEIEWRGGDPTIALAVEGPASLRILSVESEPLIGAAPALPREPIHIARAGGGLLTLRVTAFDSPLGPRRPTRIHAAISAENPGGTAEQPDWRLPAGLDIAVETTGRVRVDGASLAFFRGTPFANLALASLDGPVAFHAIDVDGDGVLDVEDAIELFGRAGATRYDRRTVYRLVRAEGADALPMPVVIAPDPGAVASAGPLTAAKRFEERLVYVIGVRNGEEDNLYWATVIAPSSWSAPFDVPGFVTGSAATISVALRGLTTVELEPDHHAIVQVNGVTVGEAFFDGATDRVVEASIPPGVLLASGNTLAVSLPGDTGAVADGVMVDRFDVGYPRLLSAAGEAAFAVSSPAEAVLHVGPLPGASAVALDVTDPLRPRRQEVALDGTGMAKIGFAGAPGGTLSIHVSTAPLAPASVSLSKGADLLASDAGADLLVVTAPGFRSAADRLAAAREAEGWRVRVVTTDEAFGAFTLGEERPDAIRALVAHAIARWEAPAPSHVLLLGDGTFDYRTDLAPFVDGSFVPVHLYDSAYNETADDNAFVDLDGDLLPELAIGRLPAASVAEADLLVDKVLAYEARDLVETEVLFVADDAVEPWEQYLFEQFPVELAALLPDYMQGTHLSLATLTPAEMTDAIVDEVNDGALWVNYVGHGSVRSWAQEQIFSTATVPQIAESVRPTVFVTMTCSNGQFQFPNASATGTSQRSLAEVALVSGPGGAIAFWSPTNPALADPLPAINRSALAYAIDGDRHTMGAIALVAKNAADPLVPGTDDVLAGLTLLGDPSMVLKANTRPTALVASAYDVPTGLRYRLDGSASHDPDGQTLAFRWTLIEAPPDSEAALTDAASVFANLYPDVPGTYRVALEVSDGLTWSAPAFATIETVLGGPAPDVGDCVCQVGGGRRWSPGSLLALAAIVVTLRRRATS